jgi:adenylate cyclase
MVGLFRLRGDSHGPHQLVLVGLVDLVLASQWPSVRELHWSLYTYLTAALRQGVVL